MRASGRGDGRGVPARAARTDAPSLAATTADDIAAMSYNRLIGLTRETNRPPGSSDSVARIAQRSFLGATDHVLEVGTATGFTAIELARLVGCRVTAIDIDPLSLQEARARARRAGVADLVTFDLADAIDTGYDAASFDMVFCGNVTSLLEDRDRALSEYLRLLRPGGLLAAVPMYYLRAPSPSLLAGVSAAIQVQIVAHERGHWLDFFDRPPLQLIWTEDFAFDYVCDHRVERFVDEILGRAHLMKLPDDARAVLMKRYRSFMLLFRDNLAHMGYTLALLRNDDGEVEPELFTSTLLSQERSQGSIRNANDRGAA